MSELDDSKIKEWIKDAEESLEKWGGNYSEDYEIQYLANRVIKALTELTRLNGIIARLKEDGERLAERPHPFTDVEHIESGTYCHYCHKSYKFEHDDNCPITLHRALMKELE